LQRAVDVGLITEAQRAEYDERPLPERDLSPGQQFRRNYYLEEVQEELLAMPELGATETDRFNTVFGGGLRVYTAYDPILQRDMEAARAETFPAGLGEFEVSVATLDHRTGQVLAFLAGPEFSESQFNLATQGRRQPGSSFKTYVLAAAFENAGFQPNDVVAGNGPCQFDVGARERYEVQNFGNSRGRVGTVRSQTLASSNCAFVRLGLATGLDNVARMADALVGRETGDQFQPFPSMSLGAQELTPLEQAIGYGALANDGVRMEPYYVERIEDADGNVLFQRVPTGKRIVSSRTAALVVDTLVANVEAPGTGGRARLDSGQEAGGKTGTAQDFTNAWFVGFTPQLTTAVWMGNPEANVPMRRVDFDGQGRINVTGGSYPARMWNAVMTKALASRPLEEFPEPPRLERGGKVIFLDSDTCPVGLGLQDGSSMTVRLPCSQVDVDGGGFRPKGSAQCSVNVPAPGGGTRSETVPCNRVSSVYGTTTTTTTTTTPPPTTPPATPSTTQGGGGPPPTTAAPPTTPPATVPPSTAAPS
jgi:penicillin-binding protein 1A